MAEAHNGKEEPIVVAAAGEGNTEMVLKINGDQDQNQEASQPQQHDEASAIGGYFSRSPPALFTFAFDEVKSYYQPIITGQYIRNIMNYIS